MTVEDEPCSESINLSEIPVILKKAEPEIEKATKYQIISLRSLFFTRKFRLHRITGLIYLIQYALAFLLYFYDFSMFLNSPLIWTLPLNGVLQSVTAIYTFTFLPKRSKDPGYFSDKHTMNYPFIVENSFFALILMFQWLYLNDKFYRLFRKLIFPEVIFVFFPYLIRTLWPKTSFRDSLGSTRSKTQGNRLFYHIAIHVTKLFFIFAKHMIGYFLNYARFMNRITETQIYHLYLLEISSAFATTISVFLHTLKFRKMIGPRMSFFIYFTSYMSTFVSLFCILSIFSINRDLVILSLIGLVLNFYTKKVQIMYQFAVCLLLYSARLGFLL